MHDLREEHKQSRQQSAGGFIAQGGKAMNIINIPIAEIKPYKKNPRKNDHAVDAVAASIKEFGFLVPMVIDKNNEIVCGHTR